MSSSRLITCAWIDTSSADTGSSQTIELGLEGDGPGDADALALSAGELVRVAVVVLGVEAHRSIRPWTALRVPPSGLIRWMSNGAAMIVPTVCRGLSEP